MNDERVTRIEVGRFLKKLLTEMTKLMEDQISETSAIDGDLQMESVAFVELQVAVEERFDVQLNPIEIVERNQFGLIVDYIYSLANADPDDPLPS